MSCSKCDREVYKEENECIFHCEKDGWKDEQIDFFYEEVKKLGLQKDDILDSFIYPFKFITKFTIKDEFTYYNNVTFKDVMEFEGITFREALIFKNCTFTKPLKFKNCSFRKELKFKDTTINGSIDFEGSTFEFKAYFFNLKKIKLLSFRNTILHEIKINDISSHLTCDFTNAEFHDSFKIQVSKNNENKFEELNFTKAIFTSLSGIKINHSTVNRLILDEYKCHTTHIAFIDIHVTEEFILNQITLEHELFKGLKLEQANLKMTNSTLTRKLFHSTSWGNINYSRFEGDKSVFRDLKHFSELSKNFIDAAAFYSLEMRAKKEELIEEKNLLDTRKEKIGFYIKNILMYELYEKVSNYSENWIRPLVILFVFGIFSYLSEIYEFYIVFSIVLFTYLLSILSRRIFKCKDRSIASVISIIIIMFVSTLFVYYCMGLDLNEKIKSTYFSTYISPFGLFKIYDNTPIGIWSFIQKLIVFILGIQIILAIKANIRNK